MKIDFNIELKNMDGEVLRDGDKVLTLGAASINALMSTYPDEKNVSGEDKLKRYDLSLRIKNSDISSDYKSEEITLIKKLIGKAFTPLVVGQAYKILEGDNK